MCSKFITGQTKEQKVGKSIQFKQQQFQTDACAAVCDVFSGQPKLESFSYIMDTGRDRHLFETSDAFANASFVIDEQQINANIQHVQISNHLKPDTDIIKDDFGCINLSVEMETGTGKTYTYIKTMYELNKRYGWTKFIVVVPSVAIREGIAGTFRNTQEHFVKDYGKVINSFIYNSSNLSELDSYARDSDMQCMIINTQAFARTADALRISRPAESFGGRVPRDVIAATRPIIIMDEPQSMGGAVVTSELKKFNPLFILRYSATHRDKYNMVYRLDAMDAYNKKLVKKIEVKGVSIIGNTASTSYVRLIGFNLFKDKNPTAKIEIDYKTVNGVSRREFNVSEGTNLYDLSGGLDEYADGWTIAEINAIEETDKSIMPSDYIRFENGNELHNQKATGDVNEMQIRRSQIRETIKSHLQREEKLFDQGIKVLSLFFIDEVVKYRTDTGTDGVYAKMFEEEYTKLRDKRLGELNLNPQYAEFLRATDAKKAHSGYFAKDKKGNLVDSKMKRGESSAGDEAAVQAYDLIIKDNKKLLSLDEPVRFIFSHSALREGWDNQNVFQICTLKQSSNDVTRRQEIGRGMRLCLNQDFERMDAEKLGVNMVHDINILTVIASETYEKFVAGLQKEYADVLKDRPRIITEQLFDGMFVKRDGGNIQKITHDEALEINYFLIQHNYIDAKGNLTETYHNALNNDALEMPAGYDADDLKTIIDGIYKPIDVGNAGRLKRKLNLDRAKFDKKEFQELWHLINQKSAYVVDFDAVELVKNSIKAINHKLNVSVPVVQITSGGISKVHKENLDMVDVSTIREDIKESEINQKYDLIGKIAADTALTRKCVADILTGISDDKFAQFKTNPVDFMSKVARIINDEKVTSVVEQIRYHTIEDRFEDEIITKADLFGPQAKSIDTPKHHIYDCLIADSNVEREMATELERQEDVCVYAKLPSGFYISTPLGKYNPDWAIAFKQGAVKHVYFVAETKGSGLLDASLRKIEEEKIMCAHKHFLCISPNEDVKYDRVKTYQELIDIVKK